MLNTANGLGGAEMRNGDEDRMSSSPFGLVRFLAVAPSGSRAFWQSRPLAVAPSGSRAVRQSRPSIYR